MEELEILRNGEIPIQTEFGLYTMVWIENPIDDDGNTVITAWLKEKNGIIVESENLEEAEKQIKIYLLVMKIRIEEIYDRI